MKRWFVAKKKSESRSIVSRATGPILRHDLPLPSLRGEHRALPHHATSFAGVRVVVVALVLNSCHYVC